MTTELSSGAPKPFFSFRAKTVLFALIAVMFVLNLSVSFTIASIVALRAYSVPAREQLQILRYIGRQFVRAPMHFIFPGRANHDPK